MSNSLAIAAVTETLRHLLETRITANPLTDPSSDPQLSGTTVTTRPPDKARGSLPGNQVNLFLYQTGINAALRNQDMPRKVKPGEAGRPPLPLNLYYLLTCYGSDDDGQGILSHRLLGRAMSILHDMPLLERADIQAALPGNDLYEQIEAVYLTPQPFSGEEIAKMWAAFQAPYRITAGYLVTVVLIESNKPVRAALPVLQRGRDESGPVVMAGLPASLNSARGLWALPVEPPPAAPPLTRILPAPGDQPVARLGDRLLLRGSNLPGEDFRVRFTSEYLGEPVELDPLPGEASGEVLVQLPQPADLNAVGLPSRQTWPPGFYLLSLLIPMPGLADDLPTNQVPFQLAPSIHLPVTSFANGEVLLSVECTPRLRPQQHTKVFLLFGGSQIHPESISTPSDTGQPTTLTFRFDVAAEDIGVFTLRLRVDGIDSLPFAVPLDAPSSTALIFDPRQQVTIT